MIVRTALPLVTRVVVVCAVPACSDASGGGSVATATSTGGSGAGGSSAQGAGGGTGGTGGAEANSGTGGSTSTEGSAGDGATGGSAGGPVTYGPPEVTAMSPSEGPWGVVVTITGSELGSAARSGVFVSLGDNALIEPDGEEVVTWTEQEVSFRVPFPHAGQVFVETPEGSTQAGEFVPPYRLGPVLPLPAGTSVLASLSVAEGQLAVALDTDPISIVEFDGSDWQDTALPDAALLPETVRLYASDGTIKVFALSNDTSPEIVDFARDDQEWTATPTGVMVTSEHAMAGGPNGAVVWFATDDQWTRARFGTTGWAVDKGPIIDPLPGHALRAAGATSDGSLYLARPRDTGNFLDDLEAPFIIQLPAGATEFDPEFKAGASVDDYLTDLGVIDRGRGVLIEYCGSDVDPFGVTGTDYKCYMAALTSAGLNLTTTANEKLSFETYHAATGSKWLVGKCDSEAGSVLTEGEAATVSVLLTWPCVDLGAVEIDPGGTPVVALRYDGGLAVLLEP